MIGDIKHSNLGNHS